MKMQSMMFTAALLGSAAVGFSQEKASVTLDGQAINIQYAPAAAKKQVVGSLQAAADIAFKGLKVPKGTYSIYILPDGAQWQLVVNKATGAKAATRDPKLDVGKFAMTMAKGEGGAAPKMTLTKTAALAARLDVAWNGTVASARFFLDRGGNSSEW
jgi:hypothetical protein